jgi:hypothetical protein
MLRRHSVWWTWLCSHTFALAVITSGDRNYVTGIPEAYWGRWNIWGDKLYIPLFFLIAVRRLIHRRLVDLAWSGLACSGLVWSVGQIVFVLHNPEVPVLGAIAKLRKVTISFVMSVCPSVHMEQLGSHGTNFHEIWYLDIFGKSMEKIKCD